ncbi:MAG: LytTR family DNA-binding domain-containing protein [Planctomycetota bacterium]
MAHRRIWLASIVVWSVVAVLAATDQWAAWRDTPKELSWLRALGWQGSSWLVLVPVTPLLFEVVRRWPLERGRPRRLLAHVLGGLVTGCLFLLASVPLRLAFHPSPMRWSFFGEAYHKSLPQAVAIGVGVYWLVVVVASLTETRRRLREADRPPAEVDQPAPATEHVLLQTPGGVARLAIGSISWAEPHEPGSRVHAAGEALLVRHTLAELESMLSGFVRTHRACLVNPSHVREVLGASSRDGSVRLASGEVLPLSRRRRAEVDEAIGAAPAHLSRPATA